MNPSAHTIKESLEGNNSNSLSFKDIGIILIALVVNCWWTSIFISVKVSLLNTLPTLIFLSMWYLFTKLSLNISNSRWCFLLAFLLTLRLPITIGIHLEFISWILYSSIIGLIGYKFFEYFRQRKSLIILCLTIIIILFNSFTHLFLDSPFTYSFRLANHLPSNYVVGKDNNLTWECSYEGTDLPVHCDMRHFIPSEIIFTESNYDASFSVLLSRFFYGYLNSLVGVKGHRWLVSFSLNIFLWISACVAMYRIAEITNLNQKIQNITIFCCSSSWGFVYFVAQPSSHMSAFALAAIVLWATLELIYNKSFDNLLLILLISSISLIYDLYHLILISSIILFIYKRPISGILIPLISIILSLIWKFVSLKLILGTLGNITNNSSPSSNLTYSFENWIKAILSLDFMRIWQFFSSGLNAYLYGGMIFGSLASIAFLIYISLNKKSVNNQENFQLLFNIYICFCSVMLIAMFFVAAQSEIWSPITKFCPRLAFYTYPVNTLAIAFFADKLIDQWGYAPSILTFIVANSTMFKLASMSVFFEYGLVGLYWQ